MGGARGVARGVAGAPGMRSGSGTNEDTDTTGSEGGIAGVMKCGLGRKGVRKSFEVGESRTGVPQSSNE